MCSSDLRMVSGGERHDAAAARIGIETGKGVVGAAKLEGARALEVFALEVDACTGARIDGARRDHWRAMGNAFDASCGAFDVVEGGKGSQW